MDTTRVEKILDALEGLYPEAKAELHFSNPFETLIATILSAQCTDKRVNQVTEKLFPLYPDAKTMARLTPEELEPMIRECGLYHSKAKNIVAACRALMEQCFLFAGVVHIQKQSARGLFPHHRSRRHLDDHVFSGLTGAPVGRAVSAVAGLKMPLEAEIHQRMHPFRGQKHHIAAPSAVAAVRAACGHVFFPVEGHAAVAAVAGLHPDIDNIYKKRHRSSFPPRQLAAQVSLHKCSFRGHRSHSGPRAWQMRRPCQISR